MFHKELATGLNEDEVRNDEAEKPGQAVSQTSIIHYFAAMLFDKKLEKLTQEDLKRAKQ